MDMSDLDGGVVTVASADTLAQLAGAEINQQIATARAHPRSVQKFIGEATALVALNETVAGQCFYAIARAGKPIEGPSARFAEIVAYSWGNCRAGARVVAEGDDFITSQGVFLDLERNVGIQYEVQRRITDSKGKRYGTDMIGVTGNAANSIALRNAVLKGVPKAFWELPYQRARAVIAGDYKTIDARRSGAVQAFAAFGVTAPQLLAKLGRAGLADVTVDDLVLLHALLNSLKDGEMSPEAMFTAGEAKVYTAPRKEASAPPPAAPPPPALEQSSPVRLQPLDLLGTGKPEPVVLAARTPAPPAEGEPNTNLATAGQKKLIGARIEGTGISIEQACAVNGISDFDHLTVDGFQRLKEWCSEQSA